MAAAATTFDSIKGQIASGNLAPVYLLHGKEGFFVDELVKAFENVLAEDEKAFNQYILYASQVMPGQVMDLCRRLPMMSDRQVVILKECQSARATDLEKLTAYVQNPAHTTLLVICFRGDEVKPKELATAVKAGGGVVYATPEIKEWSVNSYIESYLRQKNLHADDKSVQMLADFVGTSLSRLYNEINKLASILPPAATVTPEIIEKNIGVSKDYNAWELITALSTRNMAKTFTIVDYFRSNPKNGPVQLVGGALFSYFSNLLVLFFLRSKGEDEMKKFLKIPPSRSIQKHYLNGLRNYNAYQGIEIIDRLRRFDAMSKGVGSRQDPYDLLHDLMYHILTADGNIAL